MTPDLIRALLERAAFCLERGWVAAAQDALGRALELSESPP